MKHHEVGMALFGADGDVEPQQVVIVELLLEPLRQATFAGRHACDASAEGGD